MKLVSNILLMAICLFFGSCLSEDDGPLTYSEQLVIDINTIDAYLDENNIAAETDPSGLRYVVIEEGAENTPSLTSVVSVKYEGRLLSNNAVFDGNLADSDADPVSFPLNQLIGGWQIGIPKIKKGGKITLYIPSGLGYGASGSGSIPSNSNLIFDIELIDVN